MRKCELWVLILFLLVSVHSCSDAGNMFGNANQLPGTSYAHANGNQGGEISLVSLIFPGREEIAEPSVVDRITGKPIPLRPVEAKDGSTVVTLELTRGLLANPEVTFSDGSSFIALLTPEHSLSMFGGLELGGSVVFLRDHGSEREVIAGSSTDFSPGDYAELWIKGELTSAARVRLLNPGAAEDFEVSAPGCEALVKKKNQLHDLRNLQLGEHESASLVLAPNSDEETICLSVVAH